MHRNQPSGTLFKPKVAVKRARPRLRKFFWNHQNTAQNYRLTPASWYIPTPISAANISYSPSKIQKEASYYQHLATSSNAIFHFSLERLCLHETILGLSLYYQWPNEKIFQKTVGLIFQERVKPYIAANSISSSSESEITSTLRKMLFEKQVEHSKPLLLSEELIKTYNLKPKTFKTNEQRRTILVVGGCASGKARISDDQYRSLECDMLLLNPDIYKPILLGMSNSSSYNADVHAEGSIVFSKIMRYWATLAESSFAPHVLMDVARAWQWLRETGSAGNTQIQAYSPLLAISEALERSYDRGLQTGRFMPTALLIQTHKDQVMINLKAMEAGCDFTFYDTTANFDQALPVVAKFSAKEKCLDVYLFSIMMDYFQKADLCTTAINEFDLFAHTPQSIVQHILRYADQMVINLYTKSGKKLASLQKENNDNYIFHVSDMNELVEALGSDTDDFLQGLIENNVGVPAMRLKC